VSDPKHSIDIWIVMNNSGAFVVEDDPDVAAQRSEEEFENDDVRQVRLAVTMSPADGTQAPVRKDVEVD
jgi:hypothetical protein